MRRKLRFSIIFQLTFSIFIVVLISAGMYADSMPTGNDWYDLSHRQIITSSSLGFFDFLEDFSII